MLTDPRNPAPDLDLPSPPPIECICNNGGRAYEECPHTDEAIDRQHREIARFFGVQPRLFVLNGAHH